ncbi:MAG TPA: cell division protein ZapA [Deltaproteobacteria bacterium]|nr:cell division protein ZapA [Deltaproteobacteria bacterium]
MEGVVEVKILGQTLIVKSDGDETYVRAVEEHLREQIEEVKRYTKAVSTLDVVLLTALNITGELVKTKKQLDSLLARSEELTRQIEQRR